MVIPAHPTHNVYRIMTFNQFPIYYGLPDNADAPRASFSDMAHFLNTVCFATLFAKLSILQRELAIFENRELELPLD